MRSKIPQQSILYMSVLYKSLESNLRYLTKKDRYSKMYIDRNVKIYL